MQKFEIKEKLPGANNVMYKNPHKVSGIKKEAEKDIIEYIKQHKIRRIKRPVFLKFVWYEETKRRDKDNVAFGKKFIQDAMKKAGIIPDDNNNWVMGFADYFVYGKGQKVVVEIYDCDEVEGA